MNAFKNIKGLKEAVIGISLALIILLLVYGCKAFNNNVEQNKFINEFKDLYNSVNSSSTYYDSINKKMEYKDTNLSYFFDKNEDNKIVYCLVYNDNFVIELYNDGNEINIDNVKITDKIEDDGFKDSISFKHKKLSEEKIKLENEIKNNPVKKDDTKDNSKDSNSKVVYLNGINYEIDKYKCTPSDTRKFTKYEKGEEYLVNLAMGKFSTGGYNISIKNIVSDNDTNVTIIIDETYPDKGAIVAQVLTNPCTMVAFNKKPKSITLTNQEIYDLMNNNNSFEYKMTESYNCNIKSEGYITEVKNGNFIITVSSGNNSNYNIVGSNVVSEDNDLIIYVKEELKNSSSNIVSGYKKYNNINNSKSVYDVSNNSTCVTINMNKIPKSFYVVTDGSPKNIYKR